MSDDLDLIRAFRAENAAVDAGSKEKARAALLEHIDGSATDKRRARRRSLRRRVLVVRSRTDLVAIALAIFVVLGVGAVFLSVGTQRPKRPAHHAVVRPHRPAVIRNFSPGRMPALPGQTACTAELSRPSVPPAGAFYLETCRFRQPRARRSPSGTFIANAASVNGVNEHPFSITASGLGPNTGASVYAVWLLQAAQQGGHIGTFRLLQPQRPRLLGTIKPGIGQGGKLAAQGLVPPDLVGSDYLLLITLQPRHSATTPGRTVLSGFVSL